MSGVLFRADARALVCLLVEVGQRAEVVELGAEADAHVEVLAFEGLDERLHDLVCRKLAARPVDDEDDVAFVEREQRLGYLVADALRDG